MKLRTQWIVVVSLAVITLLGADLLVAKKRARRRIVKQETVEGTVKATKSKKGRVLSATLSTAAGGVYRIVLNSKGRALAKQADGKKVAVVGVVNLRRSKKASYKRITVSSFKIPVPAPPQPSKAEEDNESGDEE